MSFALLALGAALGIWLADRLEHRQYIRERFGHEFARLEAEIARIEAEAEERERNRTDWSSKDSGWGIKIIPGSTYREDHSRPDQPWNWRYLVQGLIHSSHRLEAEEWNQRVADMRKQAREHLGKLRARC